MWVIGRDMRKVIVRVVLFVTGLLAVGSLVAVFIRSGPAKSETWMTTAAALAVLTAVLSAWAAHRVVEMEEDVRMPCPLPSFDFTSRYSLAQLRVTNFGASAAYNVKLTWDKPVLDEDGEPVRFLAGESVCEIPAL